MSALRKLELLNHTEAPQLPTGIADVGGSSPSLDIQQILNSGEWYGYHWPHDDSPSLMECWQFESPETVESGSTGTIKFPGAWSCRRDQGELTLRLTVQEEIASFVVERHEADGTSLCRFTGVVDRLNTLSDTPDSENHFFFKKTATPSAMCHHPLKLNLSPKELWAFACQSVTDIVKRRRLTPAYMRERMLQFKHCVETLILMEVPGTQTAQMYSFRRKFIPIEEAELWNIVGWYVRANSRIFRFCDLCRVSLAKSMVVCLDCIVGDLEPMDLCSKPECFESPDLSRRFNHQEDHLLLKVRHIVLTKEFHSTKSRAQECLDKAYIQFPPPSDTSNAAADVAILAGNISPAETFQIESKSTSESGGSLENETVEGTARSSEETANPSPGQVSDVGTEKASDVDGKTEDEPGAKEQSSQPSSSPETGITHSSPDQANSSDTSDSESDDSEEGSDTGEKEESSDPSAETMNCRLCAAAVSAPCWRCFDCPGGCFICEACEEIIDTLPPWDLSKRYRAEVVEDPPSHTVYHMMVRFTGKRRPVKSESDSDAGDVHLPLQRHVGSRIDALAERFGQLENDVVARVDKMMQDRIGDLEKRFDQFESLLRQVIHLPMEGSTSKT
ncbi:hypothetical protein C8J56DRAFT_1047989 [Mycena floridula]|nr:hypothetical protein C8J56DRAFT_1047989 [Mycena floridula]